jgi:hypothetical protein
VDFSWFPPLEIKKNAHGVVTTLLFPMAQTPKTPILGYDKTIPNEDVVKAHQNINESCEVTL